MQEKVAKRTLCLWMGIVQEKAQQSNSEVWENDDHVRFLTETCTCTEWKKEKEHYIISP